MLPNKVNVCGVPFKVRCCDDSFQSDTMHLGEIRYGKAEILINRDMDEEMKYQTLIHEWVHGALVMIGRNELTEDECLVQSLAAAINATFTIKGDKEE
jgi:hypothetical protein